MRSILGYIKNHDVTIMTSMGSRDVIGSMTNRLPMGTFLLYTLEQIIIMFVK